MISYTSSFYNISYFFFSSKEQSPEEYIEEMVNVFRLVRNNLTDDGTLWLNIGDSYYNYRPGKGQALNKQSVSNTKPRSSL